MKPCHRVENIEKIFQTEDRVVTYTEIHPLGRFSSPLEEPNPKDKQKSLQGPPLLEIRHYVTRSQNA